MKEDWHGDAVSRTVKVAAAKAVNDAAEFLLEQANRTVPIEEHTLEASGQVHLATPDDLNAKISYDTPYALVQHEDTTLRHDPGRRAKWLERTLKEEAGNVGPFMADRIRAAL